MTARRFLRENSLSLVFLSLFLAALVLQAIAGHSGIWLASWLVQSLTGATEYNAERLSHQQSPVSWPDYLASGDFWQRTLENWQSEFLAVGSMAILAVFLRQRGHPSPSPSAPPTTPRASKAKPSAFARGSR